MIPWYHLRYHCGLIRYQNPGFRDTKVSPLATAFSLPADLSDRLVMTHLIGLFLGLPFAASSLAIGVVLMEDGS